MFFAVSGKTQITNLRQQGVYAPAANTIKSESSFSFTIPLKE
jgi:hypothetical protein